MNHARLGLALLFAFSLQAGSAQAADPPESRRRLTPDHLYRVQDVSDPRVSPDGEWVAYVLGTSDREADESRSAIWMVSWDGKQQLPLTNPAEGTEKPRWSPDGRFLAFIAKPHGADRAQIMLMDRRGGEARQLTSVAGDIGQYAWSPDSSHIVMPMLPTEEEKAPKPIVIDAWHFKDDQEGYLRTGHLHHLYLVDVNTGKVEPLTASSTSDEDEPAWSPDGRRIVFVRTRAKGPDADGREDIDIIDAHPGATARNIARPFAPNKQSLAWSPDGTLIAFLQGLEPKLNAYIQDRLFVVAPDGGGAPRGLTDKLDRAVTSYSFDGSGAIVITVEDDLTQYPARLDLKSGVLTRDAAAGPFVVSSITNSGHHTALLETSDHALPEVHALEQGKLRKLTTHNDALLSELELGDVEEIHFASRDGTDVHGLLVKPPSFQSGRKYPTLLWIHGGPNGQDEHSLELDGYLFEPQMFAARGFVVLRVNYRGGTGRGAKYAQAILADWGHKEVQDLLAGVDHVVRLGIADPARLVIGGWSYGGILTDYTIASDRRFKAAICGAGSADQLATYGSDEYVLQYENELGPPWRNTALWLKISYPFFHADRIHTPTLFLGGDKDFNVPIIGGEQMYQALRTLGVPAELVVYPGEHHVFTRPSFVKDLAERTTSWIARYVSE